VRIHNEAKKKLGSPYCFHMVSLRSVNDRYRMDSVNMVSNGSTADSEATVFISYGGFTWHEKVFNQHVPVVNYMFDD
jgi:hypothetical protein